MNDAYPSFYRWLFLSTIWSGAAVLGGFISRSSGEVIYTSGVFTFSTFILAYVALRYGWWK